MRIPYNWHSLNIVISLNSKPICRLLKMCVDKEEHIFIMVLLQETYHEIDFVEYPIYKFIRAYVSITK